MFFQQNDRHEKMAALDPRDTNQDGVVSPQEAAAYIQDYMHSATPEERSQILKDYIGGMSPDQRQQMGDAIVQSPANPVQSVNANDPDALADAYAKTAQAPVQDGKSPLEAAFAPGGMLSNPMVKAGLVGLAAMIGSSVLKRGR